MGAVTEGLGFQREPIPFKHAELVPRHLGQRNVEFECVVVLIPAPAVEKFDLESALHHALKQVVQLLGRSNLICVLRKPIFRSAECEFH